MNAIEEKEKEINDIKIALDDISYKLHHIRPNILNKDLHINSDFTISGDPFVKAANEELIRQFEKLGEESMLLTDELTKAEYELYNLKLQNA